MKAKKNLRKTFARNLTQRYETRRRISALDYELKCYKTFTEEAKSHGLIIAVNKLYGKGTATNEKEAVDACHQSMRERSENYRQGMDAVKQLSLLASERGRIQRKNSRLIERIQNYK